MIGGDEVAPGVPATMRAMLLHEPGDLRMERRPVPVPGEGEVLVKVGVVGVCGSDIHYFETGRSGSSVVRAPVVLGHEFGGRIAAVGSGVDRTIGERVSVEPGIQCGRCPACEQVLYNHCTNMPFLGAAPTDGALQDFIVVPADHAFAIPDHVTDEMAAAVEPLSVAIHGVSRARIGAADSVLVIGAGPIGVLCALVAQDSGASSVVIVDPDAGRRGLAETITGAQAVAPHGLGQMRGRMNVVLECSGSAPGLASAVDAVATDGRIVVLGVGVDRLDVEMDVVQEQEVTITGSHRYRDTWPKAIEMLSSGAIDLTGFVTHRFGLDHAEEAILTPRAQKGVLKVVIAIDH